MTRCSHGYGALETSGSNPGTGWCGERRDIPAYISERIDNVVNLGRRLLADLAICLTAIVVMLVFLHGGERTEPTVQISRETDAATIKFVAASELRR